MVIPMAAGYANNTNTFLPRNICSLSYFIYFQTILIFLFSPPESGRCRVVRFLLSQCCDYIGCSRGSRPSWFPTIRDFFCHRVGRFSARILVSSVFRLEFLRSCLILRGYRYSIRYHRIIRFRHTYRLQKFGRLIIVSSRTTYYHYNKRVCSRTRKSASASKCYFFAFYTASISTRVTICRFPLGKYRQNIGI